MQDWAISTDNAAIGTFSSQKHEYVKVDGFMTAPNIARESAVLQKFAKITPQYPGIRAPLQNSVCELWLKTLSPLIGRAFHLEAREWTMQAWYSIVTTSPRELLPIQRLPHVDGTDPNQIAMMLYLDKGKHGGTAFYRHRSTGFESLTNETFPTYKTALENDVRTTGLPPAEYITDGRPHFDRIHSSEGDFNQAVFYRGNVFHSGVIDGAAELSADPLQGRLTINAFFRPI